MNLTPKYKQIYSTDNKECQEELYNFCYKALPRRYQYWSTYNWGMCVLHVLEQYDWYNETQEYILDSQYFDMAGVIYRVYTQHIQDFYKKSIQYRYIREEK